MITNAREDRAIERLMRALKGFPVSLRIYVVDSSVVVCKRGVPSRDLSFTVGQIRDAGASLTDMHDDHNNGEVA